ncbi:MAG: PLP-dependent aspartate aminotransferase family protein, partial [Armatimonadetes bacterium]|nr:PLP-dependent aspartate aminotransferase family protein [Armatimonadota bacterium]
MKFATKPLRVGQEPDSDFRAVVPPLYQSSTFVWNSLDDIPPIDYTRCQNPNRQALEQVIAALENGTHATCFASGMAAVMASFASLSQGDHLLCARDIYGGTHRICTKLLPRYGIGVDWFDSARPESILEVAKPNTKYLIFETPTNPNLRVMDIAKIAEIAKSKGIKTICDNTFASPALQRPLDLGIDVVVHSTTKYISGHSDVIGGALVTKDEQLGYDAFEWNKMIGATPSPFDCWLSLRGVKTLSVRMQQHCANAQAVAEFLAAHPKVDRVHYPGLKDHPDHELAKRQMSGFGGMLAAEIKGGKAAAQKVAESTKLFLLAESLGGVESLMAYPPLMSHATMSEEERLAL